MAHWADEKGLTASVSKSHATLMTPDTKQSHLDPGVRWRGSPLQHVRNPKIRGVTLDPHFTFAHHAAQLATRARSRLNIMKALAGTGWGQKEQTLLTTYKLLISS